ncbi:MAG: type II secretion system protein N [Pseudomonadota bacterium]
MRRLLILVAILAGFASLVRHFPLAWAGNVLPDGIATLSGTIWNGQASGVPLLGDLKVEAGLGSASLSTPSGNVSFSADVAPGGVEDLVLSMPVSQLPTSDARLSGLSGRFSLRVDEAQIDDGACLSATGTASTDVLASNRDRFGWAGPALSGPVDCVGGRLRVRLSGSDGAQTVGVIITTGLDGVYQSDVTVDTTDPAAGNALALFGFSPTRDGAYRLAEQGRWR